MAKVQHLKDVAKAVNRSLRQVQNWKTEAWWPYKKNYNGLIDTERIKAAAIAAGRYDRLNADQLGFKETVPDTAEDTFSFSGPVKRGPDAETINLAQRLENYKLTQAKLRRLNVELKSRIKELLPAKVVHDLLMLLAARLRGTSIKIQQAGHAEIAQMLVDDLMWFEESVKETLDQSEVEKEE